MASRKFQKSIEIIDSYEGITDLVLEEGSEEWMLPVVNDSIISYILSKEGLTDSLESLAIVSCPKITTEGYRKLAALKGLRRLKLKNLPINGADVNILAGSLDSLSIFDLMNNDHIDSISFGARKHRLSVHITECNQFRYISGGDSTTHLSITLDNTLGQRKTEIDIAKSKGVYLGFINENITDSLKIRIGSSANNYLHFLSCRFDENTRFFSSLPNVRKINISGVSAHSLKFNDLQQLKTLHIRHFDTGIEEIVPLKHVIIENLPSLTYLNIEDGHLEKFQVKSVDSLSTVNLYSAKKGFNIQGIDELKTLSSFEKYGTILNDQLFEQVLGLPQISTFGYDVDTLIDKQLTSIAQSKKIKELSISPLRKVSDLDRILQMDGILSLDIGGSPIKTIRIDSHPTLRKFKARSIYEFEELQVTNCDLLEELSLEMIYPEKAVIRNVPNLTALNMGLCHLDDDKAFENQLNQLSSLKQLSLETCNKPLDLRGLKELEWIWFRNGQSKVILNKQLKDSVYTNNYKGPIVYVED
ncbi:hypothetical protein GCM10009122_38970 [Fulvivirga kasyanovii]